ncbi:MAG: hypothetical protein P4M07_28175 [Xanthobacteraceae bacterium]|nr:hypothetical protein [Xanthobacteraceae bacterium]
MIVAGAGLLLATEAHGAPPRLASVGPFILVVGFVWLLSDLFDF